MIVLGIDPGTHRTGYAFLEERENRIRVLEYGIIRCKATDALPLRLEQIHRELQALIKVYNPVSLALESIFFAKFPKAALILGHARGAIMVAGQSLGVPISEYAPRMVKQATTGKGNASKEQVASLIQSHLGLKKPPTPADAADALAIAFCHLIQTKSPGS